MLPPRSSTLREGSSRRVSIRSAHATHYLVLAEQAAPALRGPTQAVWLARLAGEHDNLRAALDWCDQRGERQMGLRLGSALWRYWWMHGLWGARSPSGSGRAAVDVVQAAQHRASDHRPGRGTWVTSGG